MLTLDSLLFINAQCYGTSRKKDVREGEYASLSVQRVLLSRLQMTACAFACNDNSLPIVPVKAANEKALF